MLFKNIFNNIFIQYLGKNAIVFYVTQGISSSIICYFVPMIDLFWYFKLIILFFANLIISLSFGILFNVVKKKYFVK